MVRGRVRRSSYSPHPSHTGNAHRLLKATATGVDEQLPQEVLPLLNTSQPPSSKPRSAGNASAWNGAHRHSAATSVSLNSPQNAPYPDLSVRLQTSYLRRDAWPQKSTGGSQAGSGRG